MKISNNRLLFSLLGFLLLPYSDAVFAQKQFFENFQYHGFVSQGFVYTTDNDFFGNSDDHGSLEFTELGFNFSGRLLNNLFASAQVLSRTAGAFDNGELKLDYGLLDYNFATEDNWLAGVRLGRVKNPYGLYNEGRDAAVNRNGIFLPQSIYFDKVRDLIHHSDGIAFYADINFDNADLFFQTAYGRSEMGENVEAAFLGNNFPGEMEDDDPISTTRLIYEYQGGLLRLAYTKVFANMAYMPAYTPPLTPPFFDLGPGGVDVDVDIFSIEYNQDKWSLTAEYMQQANDWSNFLVPGLDSLDQTAEGYYLQGTYRPTETTEVFLRYDVSHLNRADKHGVLAANRVPPPPAFSQYAHDWTIGLRWDMTKDFMLRAEYHNIEGTSWLSVQETPFASMNKDWEMFNLLISWHF